MGRRTDRAANQQAVVIEERRATVAGMVRAGRSYREIAQALGVSKTTIADDVAAVIAEWRAEQVRERAAQVAVEVARLDHALAGIWVRVGEGDETAIAVFLKLSERRAKLLGLDAPDRIAVTDDELDERITRELAGLAAARTAADAGSDPETAGGAGAAEPAGG